MLAVTAVVFAFISGCGSDGTLVTDDAGAVCSSDPDCDSGLFCTGLVRCAPGAPLADARGCVAPPNGACREGQTCVELSRLCLTDCSVTEDADGDGVLAIECGGGDCDDADPARFPGNVEVCDTLDHDEDCDPRTFGFRDQDRDGSPDQLCCNRATEVDGEDACGRDCDDNAPGTNPNTSEVCDGVDNDCDGSMDENVVRLLYPDLDDDGAGDSASPPIMGCADAPDLVSNADDCDDGNSGRNPGAPEVCDGVDNDCDETVDEGVSITLYPDADNDGHGELGAAGVRSCPGAAGFAATATDCDDDDPATRVGAPEICDAADNDCDENVDEGAVDVPWYVDSDGDTFGDATLPTVLSCVPVAGRVARDGDCVDSNAVIFFGATELCDRLDNNCSSGGGVESDEDGDLDGHAGLGAACSGGPLPKDDCNDAIATMYGGAPEACDRVDNDCSSGGGVEPDEDFDVDGHAALDAACSGGPLPKDDCVDTLATTYPGTYERCDRLDNDCSSGGGAEPSEDVDMDGRSPSQFACSGGFPRNDCDDTVASTYWGAPESCDRIDSNCSSGGGVDANEDSDQDGFAPVNATCVGGLPTTDCNDNFATSYPGGTEVCSNRDEDCNGVVDEGCAASIASGEMASLRTFLMASPADTLRQSQCPAGWLMVGIELQYIPSGASEGTKGGAARCARAVVGRVGSVPYDYQVTTGGNTSDANYIGGTVGGVTPHRVDCPANTFVTRIHNGGRRLDCAPLLIEGEQYSYSITVGTSSTVQADIGSWGASPPACATGEFMTGFQGYRVSAGNLYAEGTCRAVSVVTR